MVVVSGPIIDVGQSKLCRERYVCDTIDCALYNRYCLLDLDRSKMVMNRCGDVGNLYKYKSYRSLLSGGWWREGKGPQLTTRLVRRRPAVGEATATQAANWKLPHRPQDYCLTTTPTSRYPP